MARISIREILRFKNPIFTSPTLIHSKPHFPTCSSLDLASQSRISLYHPSLLPLQKCRDLRQLFQIQAHLITSGLFQDPFPASRILKFSADSCDLDYTILIFRYIDSPDTFCINTVIKAFSHSSVPHQAVAFYFEMMRNGFFPNSFTFPPLFNSCAKICSSESGGKCHGQAIKNGVNDVVPVHNSLIHMYASCGLIESARRLFDSMSQRDLVSWNSIVDGYAKLDDLDNAHRLFDAMPDRNVVSWNIMIARYLKGGNPGCGLKLFRDMAKTGLKGSDTTMVSVLTACGRSARLKEGRSVHGSLIRTFMKSSLILDTALIDMYSKCGRVECARKLFDRMLERNLVSWNAMILGCSIRGCPEDGLTLFAEMVGRTGSEDSDSVHGNSRSLHVERHVLPDEVTFIGVLCACARAGLLLEGRYHFSQMTNVYSIKPKFAHYWCMANLFAGVGLVQEAEQVLRSMPEEKDDGSSESLVWAGLLGSCRFRGDIDLGERIAKRLIELEPQNASTYALLSNVYAVAGRWEDVAVVKEMLKESGVKKNPGSSLVDLNDIVHKFKVGDKSQQGMEEVYMMMDELLQRLSLPRTGSPQPLLHMTDTEI
ncbi:hypothetical protein HHK36_002924 [Tetracentron sinense]|uniref:Pentatricopeptide repeat-containing protein n=1 Tax=Tetracentron sinense TaxID=13715 RepID=A0A834ZRV4_TETSI|nr:hypothetical protein HHK36_002924 [Tetracentron sinense]